jgi:hypothetical protein
MLIEKFGLRWGRSSHANSIILVAENIQLLAPLFLDAKFFAASNALNAVPVLLVSTRLRRVR